MEIQDFEREQVRSQQNYMSNKLFIKGSRFLKWFYKLLLKYYTKKLSEVQGKVSKMESKVLKNSDKSFVIKDINFYSSRLIIVMFQEMFTEYEYEITLQDESNWVKFYEEYQKTNEVPFKLKHLVNVELAEQYDNGIRIK